MVSDCLTNPSIRIVPFDPQTASDELWAAFHDNRRAVEAELWPSEPMLSDDEIRTEIRQVSPLWEFRRWLALEGAEVVGSVRVGFRRPGTPNAADHASFLGGGGAVRSEARRHGVGTLLLREVRLMHVLDKTVLTLSAHTEPGHAFLKHIGAVEKNRTVENCAVFAELDWSRLREWEGAATAGKGGLVWERYAGRVPRDVLLTLLPVFTTLFVDVPLGGLETAPIRWEISGYDQLYETFERVGGAHHVVLVRVPDSTVAGLSEATWDARAPEIVRQQLTAVARPWRGRGLGRAIKAAMLRQAHECHPEATVIGTNNAGVNAPMLSINARVGFKVAWRNVDYQVTRAALDVWVGLASC
jgi:GNAT superfamily N-acetyltransferase